MSQCSFCEKTVPSGTEQCPHCGAWLNQSDAPAALEATVRSLLSQGRKIEAIKVYRGETGVGLAEAKNAVERLEQGKKLADQGEIPPQDLEPQLLTLLAAGQKIPAIK